MAIPFDTSSGGARNTSRRKRHRRKDMTEEEQEFLGMLEILPEEEKRELLEKLKKLVSETA